MKVWALAIALGACSSTHGTGTGSGGSGLGSAPPVANAKTCDDVKARVEQMYRGEAQVKEPKRVDEAVADNTAMVMKDCAKDPDKTVPCLARAGSVAELEKQCLIQLDDEGTEGEALAK
ncbi:MAG TPA: hypothetical protein VFV99_06060 [Kofleriaceae bacterium]|nr:hypothetical protein [Kofleriaceae bacterium]